MLNAVLIIFSSEIERWEINDTQLNKNSFTNSYDSQGRLIGIEGNAWHEIKPTIDISTENQDEDALVNSCSLTTTILQIIDEILPVLLRNENIDACHSDHFQSIHCLLTNYILDEFMWSLPLLKRLYQNVIAIKQLLDEKENGKNYDVDYLNILFARIEQRVTNIDLGIHFREDHPYIIEQLEYENVLDERQKRKQLLGLLPTLNESSAAQCLLYVQKCIDLHSYIRIMGISKDNIEHLATRLNIDPMMPDEKEYLSQKCSPIVIPLRSFVSYSSGDSGISYDSRGLPFMEGQRHSLTDNVKQQTLMNDSRNLYRLIAETPLLPASKFNLDLDSSSSSSLDQSVITRDIFDIIDKYRWIVILGDPGSAKTTLARWLTLLCAKKFIENKINNNNHNLSARLPVLVRVGEIASALDRDASLSLFDCLCEPKWFGTSLVQIDHEESFIREYIKHGHALIILDGLDEIPNFRQRQHIVRLIEEFLQEWTICPVTFIAPFDKSVSSDMVKPLSCSTMGNQVIITSRIVGYYMCPIASSRIQHFILAPLTLPVIHSFIDHWFKSIYLALEVYEFKSIQVMIASNVLADELKSMLTNNQELQKLASNPMMLAVLCTLSLLQSQEEMLLLRKQRICLLHSLSQFTLRSSIQRTEEANVALNFLIDIAVHLHERSPSGLVEELDMKNILRRSVNNREDIIDSFIQLINSETCLFVPRGLCIYGFSHLLYEEYYVCLHILKVTESNLPYNRCEYIANQFYRHTLYGSRFREPLILALSYISWQCSETDYNAFCNGLLNDKDINRFSDLVPLGTICLLSSISELVRLPSTEVLYTMLNQCTQTSVKNQWFEYLHAFAEILQTALNELPIIFVHDWLLKATDEMIDAIGQLILRTGKLPLWFDQHICQYIWKQLSLKNHRLTCCLAPLIVSLDKTLLPKIDLCQYMITNEIKIENIHPLILAVVICLCGGLTDSKTDQDIIIFSPEWMHRQSDYSFILTRYLYSDPQALLDYCHDELSSRSSPLSADLLIMCCCLEGCNDEMLTLTLIEKLQQLALYICRVYLNKASASSCYKPDTKKILALLKPLIDYHQQDNLFYSPSLITTIALSRLLSIRETNFPNTDLLYELSNLDEEHLNSEWFNLSKSFQAGLIPASYRHLLSSQSLSLTHRTFLSAAYIIELCIDANERWCDLNNNKLIFTENSIQKILTANVAQWIHTQIGLANEEECYRLSQALHRCETFRDAKTNDILTEWLSYSTSSSLREFAYHAAVLLFNSNATATVLCCQLLGNELDDFRRRAEELFKNNVVSGRCLGRDGLISLVEIRRNWTLSVAPHVLESFRSIQIRLVDDYLLDFLYELLENIEVVNVLESFSFIFDPSIQANFITKLEHCHTATEDYIATILKIFARSKGKWTKFEVNRGTTAIFRLLRKYSDSTNIANATLEVFTRWKSYSYICHMITESYYPESTRIRAIRWLYKSDMNKKYYELLEQLTLEASSSMIVDAAWEGIIYSKCNCRIYDYDEPATYESLLTHCSDDRLRVFRTLIALHNDSRCALDGDELPLEIFEELCIQHEFTEMDATFVNVICFGLTNAQNNLFSTLSDTHLVLVLEYIKRREIEFLRAVQNSVLGEQGFKNALLTISKKSDVSRRLAALNLLVSYGELTIDIAKIFLDFSQENFYDQKRACRFIWRLKRILKRETCEYLFDKLSTKSLQQRYMTALLLVQLALNDQVSTNTVCRYIKNIIKDPTSAKNIYFTSELFITHRSLVDDTMETGRLDHALITLLMQFSFIAGKPASNKSTSFSHYVDLYSNYDHLFEQIRDAPRLLSSHYKTFRFRHHIDRQSNDDYFDSDTTDGSHDNNCFEDEDEVFNFNDHSLTEDEVSEINEYFQNEKKVSNFNGYLQDENGIYHSNDNFENEEDLSDDRD